MEKLIFPIWKPTSLSDNAFRDQLLEKTSTALISEGVKGLSVCVVDDDVQGAAQYRIEYSTPPANGMLSVWLDTAIYRNELERIIQEDVEYFSCYLVTESEPLVNTSHLAPIGQRTPGMNQVVFLQRPERIPMDQWFEIWHYSHAQIAMDIQSNFAYRQNVISRKLRDNSSANNTAAFDAIVEESFPEAAIHSRAAFYDAADDKALYEQREKTMMESCLRFLDFDKLDCLPMSEYIMKP